VTTNPAQSVPRVMTYAIADSASPWRWMSTNRTHVGKVRRVNQDALLERPDIGLWVIADGMGGHASGEIASGLVIESLRDLPAPTSLSGFVDTVEDRILGVNAELRAMAAGNRHRTMGTTVAALLAYAHLAVTLWAGDSRIYRYREQRLERLTHDHALVEDLVDSGMLTRAQAERHPHANLVTRAVGAADDLFLDIDIVELMDKDVFLLCTDGLTKELTDKAIAKTMACNDGEDAIGTLITKVLEHGARDNTTIITVKVSKADPASTDEHSDADDEETTVRHSEGEQGAGA